jgi:hypothetical protein
MTEEASTTTATALPDVKPGDRITVAAGAKCVPSHRRTTKPCDIEVTYVRQEVPGFLTVSGLVLTRTGTYSAAGAMESRNCRSFLIAGPAGDAAAWQWLGETPAECSRAALVADLVVTYGVDRREAATAVERVAEKVQRAAAGAYGTPGNVPGWSTARNEPTAAGAATIRESLAAQYATTAARAASSAIRLGSPRTIDPRGRMVFTDGTGRGWVIMLRAEPRDTALIVGSIAPHETIMRPLTSGTWPEGVPTLAGDGAYARARLHAVAEPATVNLPVLGDVPALGAYLRPVALACADAVTGRWLVVAWPDGSAPVVVGDSDESTLARARADQAVGLYRTTRVYLARRHQHGTTVYARTGEGAAFGTMPAEVPNAEPGGPSARSAWEHVVRGAGSADPQTHAANVLEAKRRALGLPEGTGAEQVEAAAAEQTAHGDQPWLAFMQAFVHVVGDPVAHHKG